MARERALSHLNPTSWVDSRAIKFMTSGIMFSSVAQSYLILVTPWTAARQAFLSITNSWTHVHWVGGAIQPSHPLSSPSPPALNLSQHHGLFESALHFTWPKYWSFSISPFNINPTMSIQDWSLLGWTGWISLHSKGLSRASSNTTVQKHQFFGAQLSL